MWLSFARYLLEPLVWPQLLALVGIRKAMECIFSRQDLSWLDDIMPEDDRKEEEEKLQRSQEKEESDSEDVSGARKSCLPQMSLQRYTDTQGREAFPSLRARAGTGLSHLLEKCHRGHAAPSALAQAERADCLSWGAPSGPARQAE